MLFSVCITPFSDFKEKNTTQNIGFHPSFSRHAKDQTSLALVIWLNENVPFLPFVSEFFRYKYEVVCNAAKAKSIYKKTSDDHIVKIGCFYFMSRCYFFLRLNFL